MWAFNFRHHRMSILASPVLGWPVQPQKVREYEAVSVGSRLSMGVGWHRGWGRHGVMVKGPGPVHRDRPGHRCLLMLRGASHER